jgi:hypothetical protein
MKMAGEPIVACAARTWGRLYTSHKTNNERANKQDQKQEEQNLRYAGECARYAAKSKNSGDYGDHQEDERIV